MISFVLVATVAAASLSLGTYAIVREYRLTDFHGRSNRQAQRIFTVVPETIGARDLPRSLQALQQPDGLEYLVVVDGEVVRSTQPGVEADSLPTVATGRDGRATDTIRVDGRAIFVVGQGIRPGLDLYLLFDEDQVLDTLEDLGLVLTCGSVVIVGASALFGNLVARRTLRPVREAARAAEAIAGGLLETRLPADVRDEFGAWAVSFNAMAAALEQKLRALEAASEREQRFAGDIAHELRTPITTLVAVASLLEQTELPPSAQRPAVLVATEARRLHRLVEDLLELHQLDSSSSGTPDELSDVGEVVRAVVARHRWDAVELDLCPDVVVAGDARRLERIVFNLVDNALAHGAEPVRVTARRDGAVAFLSVTDAGSGIQPDQLPHVFERFYKADGSRSGRGSGLGLAIVAEHVRSLRGTVDVSSTIGSGTTVSVTLPTTSVQGSMSDHA